MRSISLVFGVVLSVVWASTAAATPFEPRTVPEQVDGIGHVDVDAVRRTQLFGALGGQVALDALLDDVPSELRTAAKSLSRSIRAISFWYDNEDGALQIATSDPKALGQLLGKLPMKQVRTVEGVRVFVYDKPGHDTEGQIAAVGDTLVLSDSAECLDRAVRVLYGKTKSISGSSQLPSLGRQGVFFFVAIGDDLLGKIQRSASSKLMRLSAKSLVIDVSESAGQLTAAARAEMKSADSLEKAKSIAEGLRALGSLSDEPGVTALLNGVTVTTSGLSLEVTAKLPVADVAKLVREK